MEALSAAMAKMVEAGTTTVAQMTVIDTIAVTVRVRLLVNKTFHA
jgi:hypothetical protein